MLDCPLLAVLQCSEHCSEREMTLGRQVTALLNVYFSPVCPDPESGLSQESIDDSTSASRPLTFVRQLAPYWPSCDAKSIAV